MRLRHLLPLTATPTTVRVVIGPVDAAAARVWTTHLLGNLAVVRSRRDLLPFRLPDEVAASFEGYLRLWAELAAGARTFHWEADLDLEEVRSLVRYWANLDSLGQEHLDALSLAWSPLEARPFFEALSTGVAAALEAVDGPDAFAELLVVRGRQQVDDATGRRERSA